MTSSNVIFSSVVPLCSEHLEALKTHFSPSFSVSTAKETECAWKHWEGIGCSGTAKEGKGSFRDSALVGISMHCACVVHRPLACTNAFSLAIIRCSRISPVFVSVYTRAPLSLPPFNYLSILLFTCFSPVICVFMASQDL
jgi:hypothetical protein